MHYPQLHKLRKDNRRMKDIRYSLEKYRGRTTRYHCPECHERTFTRYIDNLTGKHLAEHVGRCNREGKCGYHFPPKTYFERNGIKYKPSERIIRTPKKKLPPSCIDKKVMLSTFCNYHQNNFALGLYQYFPQHVVNEVLMKYYVGTAKGNKTIFWQVNRIGQVRTGKVMEYSIKDIKRCGDTSWAHSKLRLKNYNLVQVFFGSHLLVDKSVPVAIAEGEKNAILGALYYPQYNWIAVGAIGMLNVQKLNALRGYQVILFPDKGKAFDKWRSIAQKACFDVKVNNVLEKTDLKDGDDIADLVISIKSEQYLKSPECIIDKFKKENKEFGRFMQAFDLVVSHCT